MAERERFTTTLDGELLRKIKILAINRRCSTNILIEEAIADILEKYEKEPPFMMASKSVEISHPAIHEPSSPYNPKTEKQLLTQLPALLTHIFYKPPDGKPMESGWQKDSVFVQEIRQVPQQITQVLRAHFEMGFFQMKREAS